MKADLRKPHGLEIEQVLEGLKSASSGLDEAKAAARLAEYGPNELPAAKRRSLILLFLKQFSNWLVIILIIAAGIAWFAGEMIDTWVIVAVVIINAAIGFSQEYRAERAIESLRKMIVRTAKVIRGGELRVIDSSQLVPGDVIVLEEGDRIPADARILLCRNLRTMEASLTGESLPISKKTEKLDPDTVLGDRKNMVWNGTFVAGGYAQAVVTGTGMNTAIGRISESLVQVRRGRTNFMKKTDFLARQMSIIAIFSAVLILLVGWLVRDFDFGEILLTSIAALVAAVPEGLPAVISIVLALGAHRMARKKAIVREFTATETLGAVTAILTDKTGTLTQSTLTVRKVFVPGQDELSVTGEGWFPAGNFKKGSRIIDPADFPGLPELLKVAAISNNSEIREAEESEAFELIGDPTEGALLVLARKGGLDPEELRAASIDDFPFDSTMKMRATLHKGEEGGSLCVAGAPEMLLEASDRVLVAGREEVMTTEWRSKIRMAISTWSGEAMRVLALARKPMGDAEGIESNDLQGLVLVGIVGMIDPPRPQAREAVLRCRQAGIRVIMVTGDHVNTAVAIAGATGLITEGKSDRIHALTQQQLERLSPKEFDEAVRKVSVFARLTPAMKLRIASRLQAQGELIAMTGDGVNDAPALKKADVAVSMGLTGTDVARDASDVVLADDRFSTIVNAVEQGRIVFANARRTSMFLVATNIAETITLLAAIAMGLPIPLTATQILWLNLVTDGVTDMALATEPGHGSLMRQAPVGKSEPILDRKVLPFMLINVVIMAALTLGAYLWYLDRHPDQARTGAFVVMAATQLFNVFNLRSLNDSVFRIGMFSNRYINLAVGVSALLLVLITQVPALAVFLHFEPIGWLDYLVLGGASSAVLWAGELYKLAVKKQPGA